MGGDGFGKHFGHFDQFIGSRASEGCKEVGKVPLLLAPEIQHVGISLKKLVPGLF